MARFYPDVPSGGMPESERAVAQALRRLTDDYLVLQSLSWLRPNRDVVSEPAREGEADFVVVHPDLGLLIVEVKGGAPEYSGRTWWRAGKVMRDPFDQARRSRYALIAALEEHTGRRLSREKFTHGDLVVFPQGRFVGQLPLHTEPRLIVDSTGLDTLPQRIEAAYAAWFRVDTHFSEEQMLDIRNALTPRLRLLKHSASQIAAEQERIAQLTFEQREVLFGLLDNERVVVSGTAGSGKTLLALEFALTLAAQGQKVLLLCYNRNLCAWLQEQAAKDPIRRGKLQILTFHGLAVKLTHRAKMSPPALHEQGSLFWDEVLPDALEACLAALPGDAHRVDAVIVDEAQDFAPRWWRSIEALVRPGKPQRFYAFFDMKQSLRGHAEPPPIAQAVPFRLSANCRNTRSIARVSAALGQVETRLLPSAPEGEAPALLEAKSGDEELGQLKRELLRLREEGIRLPQIVLMGPSSWRKGLLASVTEIAGIPLTDSVQAWQEGRGVLVTTARAFKGLEAPVVILYGVADFGGRFSETDLYVACTRASNRLVIVGQAGEALESMRRALREGQAKTV